MKKLTKMHWYVYNNTVPLLNIAKTLIFHLVYNLIFLKFSTILSAGQPASQPACQLAYLPAIRTGSISTMAPDFSQKKDSLQNCYSEEGSSFFILHFFPFS